MEADRYGSDPWVFVRELLQNARDAGAGEVRFTTERSGATERIICRDDGEGMTFEHARAYLFTLYSSSKRDDPDAAGRFGIGFWSVLRFQPAKIIIRSRPGSGDGWEVAVDGGFRSARRRSLVMRRGTEIILERATSEDDLKASVAAAVRSEVRILTRRDDPTSAVEIILNDELVDLQREPEPPCLTVEEPGLHLTVALSERPRVEVFARGLRVRRVNFLDELLTDGKPATSDAVELPEGLLPRVTLDSSRLEVLLARGDARHDRTMAALVRRAERELASLVTAELDRIAGRSRLAGVWDRIRASSLRSRWTAAAATAILAVAVVVGFQWRGHEARGGDTAPRPAAEVGREPAALGEPRQPMDRPLPHRDLAAAYSGPTVDSLATPERIDLRYRPELAQPLFGALRLGGLDELGRPLATGLVVRGPYLGPACVEDCLAVDVRISGGPGLIAIPVASGHRIDPASVRFDGDPAPLVELDSGDPALSVDRPVTVTLSYLSGPVPAAAPSSGPSWPELPPALARAADEIAAIAPSERAARAAEMVASAVAYDRSPAAAARWDRLRSEGGDFLAAAVAAGAGDCDVQNAVLAAVLSRGGTPSWLVVGYVGASGRLRPGLHAWVEYREAGQWRVADASGGISASVPAPMRARDELAAPPDGGGGEGELRTASAEPGDAIGAWIRRWWPAVVALALLAAVAGLGARRRATARAVAIDGTVDLARLLRSALLRPGAFGGVAALFDRPLVPTVDGRRLSLRTIAARSRAARLFRSSRSTALAVRAARRGHAVLDAEMPEAAAVADLLGARDLDDWEGMVDRARSNRATEDAAAALGRLGSAWTIAAAEGSPRRVSTIEGRVLGRGYRRRVAVVDSSSPLWRVVEASVVDRPAWAALVLAEGLASRLDLPSSTRDRWLVDLARRALDEGGRPRA
jgi:hypothetical protein